MPEGFLAKGFGNTIIKTEMSEVILDIDPFIMKIGHFGLRWFSLFVAVSLAAGLYYFIKNGLKGGLDEDFLYNLAILIVVGGLIGTRAVYVATNWNDYAGNLVEVFRLDHGGMSWHGALLGGGLAAWFYAARKGVSFNLLADLAVPGLTLGYFLGRIGDIFNHDIPGRVLENGLRQPAQVYGALIGLGLLLLHNYMARRKPPAGYLFWNYILYYQIFRGLIEETVRDNPLYLATGPSRPGYSAHPWRPLAAKPSARYRRNEDRTPSIPGPRLEI